MPAVIPFGFYQGSRSEYMALYLLSRLCVTVPVPRQSDFGIDLLCYVSRRDGKRVVVGAPFAVQVKSSVLPIAYPEQPAPGTSAEVRWLLDQSIPLFLCIIDRVDQRMRLYSTWALPMLRYLRGYEYDQVVLEPDTEAATTFDSWQLDGNRGILKLGPPILSIQPTDVEDNVVADKLAAILGKWVEVDQENCVNKAGGICYVQAPEHYETNEMPSNELSYQAAFGPAALPGFRRRLGVVASLIGMEYGHSEDQDGIRAMVQTLEHVRSELDAFGLATLDDLNQSLKEP